MKFFDENFSRLEGNNDLTRVVDEAAKAKPNAFKSGREVRAAALQYHDGEMYVAHAGNSENGSARHAETLAVDLLYMMLPDGAQLSVNIIGFYDPYSNEGSIARICGRCRYNLYTSIKGVPVVSNDAQIVGAGKKSAVVVPWKNYLAEPWKESIIKLDENTLERELDFSRAIYTKKPIVGAFICGEEKFFGAAFEYSSPEREIGPIAAATQNFIRHSKSPPDGFLFAAYEMPDVNYAWRQALIDRMKGLGVENPDGFKIYRASIKDAIVEEATIGALLPYAYKSLKS